MRQSIFYTRSPLGAPALVVVPHRESLRKLGCEFAPDLLEVSDEELAQTGMKRIEIKRMQRLMRDAAP